MRMFAVFCVSDAFQILKKASLSKCLDGEMSNEDISPKKQKRKPNSFEGNAEAPLVLPDIHNPHAAAAVTAVTAVTDPSTLEQQTATAEAITKDVNATAETTPAEKPTLKNLGIGAEVWT